MSLQAASTMIIDLAKRMEFKACKLLHLELDLLNDSYLKRHAQTRNHYRHAVLNLIFHLITS